MQSWVTSMQTIRTISNISFNSLEFFEHKVFELLKNGVIDWCHWIAHKAEDDEKKAHIHFVLKPSCRIDTNKLRQQFFELDATNALPLAPTTDWRPVSSMDDWLLYAVHDTDYLKSKRQTRKFAYMKKDIRSTDFDALNECWRNIDRTKYARLRALEDAVAHDIPFFVLVQDGIIPIAQRAQWQRQYMDLQYVGKHRYLADDGEQVEVNPSVEEVENKRMLIDDELPY